MPLTIYGEPKYNEAYYLGQSAETLRWGLTIDWRSDGTWDDGFNEASRLYSLTVERGRSALLSGVCQGWRRHLPGLVTAVLDNDDGRYDPFNTSGPLYGYIAPGKFARLVVVYDGTTYPIMRGIVQDIQPFNEGSSRKIRLTIADPASVLAQRSTNRAVTNNSEAGVVVMSLAATAIPGQIEGSGVEWGQVFYGAGRSITRTFFWRKNALQSIHDICDAEMGQAFFDAQGQLAFVQAAYDCHSCTEIDQSEVLRDIKISQPWEVVRNTAEIGEHTYRDAGSVTTIWTLDKELFIRAGESITLDALFSYLHYQSPGGRSLSQGADFNTQADGGGSALSGSMDIDLNGGEGTEVTYTNLDTQDGYVLGPDVAASGISGEPVININNTVYSAEHLASQAQYGLRTFKLDSRWLEGGDLARQYAAYIVTELANPRIVLEITIENRPELQFGKELYIDLIEFTSDKLGISDTFRIGRIKHEWVNPTGQFVRTTYTLEPYLTPFTVS